jgi:hypothetical protein
MKNYKNLNMNNELGQRSLRGTQGKKQFSQRPRIITEESKTTYQPYQNLKFNNLTPEMPKIPKYSENEVMIKQRYNIL